MKDGGIGRERKAHAEFDHVGVRGHRAELHLEWLLALPAGDGATERTAFRVFPPGRLVERKVIRHPSGDPSSRVERLHERCGYAQEFPFSADAAVSYRATPTADAQQRDDQL